MVKYPKIESLYNRDKKTFKFIEGEYRLPEFEYLKDNQWHFTEKVDGTNIRVAWDPEAAISGIGFEALDYRGRTDEAQMPKPLEKKLVELLPFSKFMEHFPETSLCLYGEGYGAGIQKGGGKYNPDGVGFVLFDVLIDDFWLRWWDIDDIAEKLGIDVVPIVGTGTLQEAVKMVKGGLWSKWSQPEPFEAEGLVLKPAVEMRSRDGRRIITKIKHKDFAR